jgi:hypothetical protein
MLRTLYSAALTDPVPERWVVLMRQMEMATGTLPLEEDTAAPLPQAGE